MTKVYVYDNAGLFFWKGLIWFWTLQECCQFIGVYAELAIDEQNHKHDGAFNLLKWSLMFFLIELFAEFLWQENL